MSDVSDPDVPGTSTPRPRSAGHCAADTPTGQMGDERFRAMAEALPSMVFEADVQGANLWSSEAWARYTGLALAELTGMGWQQIIHPEDQARNRAAWQEAIRSGTGFSMPHRLRRYDGQWLWHLMRVVPMRDAAGRIEAWVGSATDIDEMVRTQDHLVEQEHRAGFLLALNEHLRELADPQAMMDAATATLGEELAVAQVGYAEIDETQQHILVHRDWNDGRIPSVVGTWRLEDFGLGYAREMRAGRVAAIADIRLDPRIGAPDVVRAYEGIHTRAILDVPLVKQGRLVAMLFVHHPEPRDWTHAEVDLVEQTCERLWAAVERAHAERALAASEAHLSAVLDALPVGVVLCDAQGRLTRHNAAHRALWGLGDAEMPWRHYSEWVGLRPDSGERIPPDESALARALHRGEVVYGQVVECRPVDGSPPRIYLNNAAPVRGSTGSIVGGVAIEVDVTEQRAATAELTRRTQELTQTQLSLDVALAAGRMGVWDWSLQTDESRWNQGMFELLGLPAQEDAPVSGGLFLSLVHPEDRPEMDARLARAFAGNGTFESEVRVIRGDGQVRWLVGRGEVLRDDEGHPCRMVGVNFDITERKLAEQALQEADRHRNEFLAMLGHELRNPLAPIVNAVRLLEDGADRPTLRQAAVQIIQRQSTHLARLVDDLLEVSRVTQGRIELRKENVLAATAILSAAESVRPLVREQRQSLKIDVPTDIDLVADPARLTQIVANLLGNAAKYTPAGGHLVVQARADAQTVEIRVTDDGSGIDTELLPRIFDLFSQGAPTLDRARGGLGLGLTLVKRLVELHGGTVQAESPGPGHGSTFIVRLPRAERRYAPRGVAAHLPAASVAPTSILVVDDNADAAESLAMLLEAGGHRVRIAYDGEQAMVAAREFRPRAVLLDIGLPRMDGYAVAQALRADPALAGMAIVALSGYGQTGDRERSRHAGFDAHLLKPVELEEVFRTLAGLLHR